MPACQNGHLMTADERFCLVCGAPAIGDEGRPTTSLLPPFDAERFRADESEEPDAKARTVPVWVLVAVIVLGLAGGIVLGAVR
jgi:hypothetical protein